MKLFTKLQNYLQDLPVFTRKQRSEAENATVMAVSKRSTERSLVYTPQTGVYDWAQEQAKLRHPSNYKNRSNK